MYAVRARCDVVMAEWPASSSVLITGLRPSFLCKDFDRLTAPHVGLRLLANPADEHGHYVSNELLLFEMAHEMHTTAKIPNPEKPRIRTDPAPSVTAKSVTADSKSDRRQRRESSRER
jgi:hypothetical protein